MDNLCIKSVTVLLYSGCDFCGSVGSERKEICKDYNRNCDSVDFRHDWYVCVFGCEYNQGGLLKTLLIMSIHTSATVVFTYYFQFFYERYVGDNLCYV